MSITGKLVPVSPAHTYFQSIILMDQQHFPRPWPEKEWRSYPVHHHMLYAWEDLKILKGFALFNRVSGDKMAHLLKVCLAPEYRGKGEAAAFWEEIVTELKAKKVESVYLEVEKTNKEAQKFYIRQGFITLKEVKAYYSDGTDARMMSLTL